MKIAALVKKFNKEVELQHDSEDYARCVAWLRALGVSPGAKAPTGKGIVPYLVHNAENSAPTISIEWE